MTGFFCFYLVEIIQEILTFPGMLRVIRPEGRLKPPFSSIEVWALSEPETGEERLGLFDIRVEDF